MRLFRTRRLARRFSTLALVLTVCTFALTLTTTTPVTQAAPLSAPVNVPAAILYAGNCYDLLNYTTEVDFYYYKLDGTVGGRSATVDNGGLTANSGVPTIQFYQLSYDYKRTTGLYEFILTDNQVVDIYVSPEAWGRDQRNGNIFATLPC